ncbi:hypothetical protein IV81_GL000237 [Pediococcus stilesii]|uniref:Uncharacterized protein n=2 Tax=Pediococcus stilesii TaxID=331679 RepID=A0A0R2L3N2_9LACO|nr:hypothetical protein IV81_GL000237 [Pediococcus stilesii]
MDDDFKKGVPLMISLILLLIVMFLIYLSPIPKLVRNILGSKLKYFQWATLALILLLFVLGTGGILLLFVLFLVAFLYFTIKYFDKKSK